jgi:asparagine synthase (glutamine-hydrolysing)
LCLADQEFWLVDTYLEKSDKGSMAHSLELRVPFLDNEVVEFANSLPDRLRVRRGVGKWLLRQAFRDHVPPGTFDRFKRGFSVPLAEWLRTELKDYFQEQVLGAQSRSVQFLLPQTLARLHLEHCRQEFNHEGVLWQVLVFETWLRRMERYLAGGSSRAVGGE